MTTVTVTTDYNGATAQDYRRWAAENPRKADHYNARADTLERGDGDGGDALAAALAYAARGWAVFPCREKDGEPYQDRNGKTVIPREKSPYTPHGCHDATTDPATIRAWWGRWPGAAIGGHCGPSGNLAVDLDSKDDKRGPENWAALGISEAGALIQRTPSGGLHIVYRQNAERLGCSNGGLGNGIDTRGWGGYIILPGSRITAGEYIALNDWGADPAPIPGALEALLTRTEKPEKTQRTATAPTNLDDADLLTRARNATNGAKFAALHDDGRLTGYDSQSEADLALCIMLAFWTGGDAGQIDRLFRLSALYRDKWDAPHREDGATYGEMTIGAALARQTEHYTPQATTTTPTATTTAAGATVEAQARDLLKAAVDHEGHAQVVLRMHAGQIAYNAAFGWLWYTGTHWARDQAEAHITRAIVDTLKARAIAGIKAEMDMDKFVKKCSCDAGRIAGIMTLLESITYTPATRFDAAPHLLNCHNGVLNLRDLTLTPHAPGQKFTYCLGANYDPTAHEGAAYRDLLTIIDDWTPDAAFLQVAGGYSLTGDTSEEVLFYMLGPARAGKGSFTEALLTLLPYPLATEAGFETFANDRGGDSQNFDLAPLRPCRAVFSSESERRHQLNAARVKRLTGGNWITCAYKYRDQFTYRPAFKIWLSSNFAPSLDPDDDAAWGRVKVLKFPNSHLGGEDLSIKKRLKSPDYQAALLHWLTDGAAIWHATGLPRATEGGDGARIAAQTQAERDAQDYVLQFTDERLTATGNEADRLTTAEVHTAYDSWCKANGVPPRYINQFTQALKAKGWDYRKMPGGIRCFVGVKLC